MSVELNFTGNIRRLRLRFGDIVCIESDTHISPAEADDLYNQLDKAFPRNEVILFSQGLRVSKVICRDTTSLTPPEGASP